MTRQQLVATNRKYNGFIFSCGRRLHHGVDGFTVFSRSPHGGNRTSEIDSRAYRQQVTPGGFERLQRIGMNVVRRRAGQILPSRSATRMYHRQVAPPTIEDRSRSREITLVETRVAIGSREQPLPLVADGPGRS